MSTNNKLVQPDDVGSDWLKKAQEGFDAASEANAAGLTGKVPDDVWQAVEQRTAESSAMQGMGIGNMTGKKTARDLGLTSLQLQQQAIGTEAGIAAQRAQVGASIGGLEAQNRQLDIAEQSAKDTTALNIRRTDLMFDELKANTELKYVEYLSGLAQTRSDVQMKFYLDDQGNNFVDSGAAGTYDSILSRIESRLKAV